MNNANYTSLLMQELDYFKEVFMLSKMKLRVMLDLGRMLVKTSDVLANVASAMSRTAQRIHDRCWDIIFEDNDMEMAERMPEDW